MSFYLAKRIPSKMIATSWCTGTGNFGFMLLFACDIDSQSKNIFVISVKFFLYIA